MYKLGRWDSGQVPSHVRPLAAGLCGRGMKERTPYEVFKARIPPQQHLILPPRQDTSVVTRNSPHIRRGTRGGKHRNHQLPTRLRVLGIGPGGSGVLDMPYI